MLVISFHPDAEKELLHIPKKSRLAITGEIDSLEKLAHPLQHRHVKKLKGRDDRYRMKVRTYRVKMELREGTLLKIYHIERRQAGYRNF